MSYITEAELIEIVPDLRALASTETCPDVQAALIRLADRYAAMATGSHEPLRATIAYELAA